MNFNYISLRQYKKHVKESFRPPRSKPAGELLKSSKPIKDSKYFTEPLERRPRSELEEIKNNVRIPVFGNITLDGKTFEKMRADESYNHEDMNEEDFQQVLHHSEDFYDMYKMEQKSQRATFQYKDLERKCFKPPVEPCLLTIAAKDQIRYLNGLDPEEWTYKTLAEHFPISVRGIKKLLRNKPTYLSKQKIERHDSAVSELWKRIKKGEIDDLDITLQERWHQGKLVKRQSLLNLNFPTPPTRDTNPPPPVLLSDPSMATGEFYSIVETYVNLKQKEQTEAVIVSEVKPVLPVPNNFSRNRSRSQTAILDYVDEGELGDESDRYELREEPYDSDSRTIMDDVDEDELEDEEMERHELKAEPHYTHEQFSKNMVEDLQRNSSPRNREMLNWLKDENNRFPEPESKSHGDTDTKEFLFGVSRGVSIQKMKAENVDMKHDIEKRGNVEQSQPYLYSPQTSYQHPLGRDESSSDRIEINETTQKEGDLYRVGNSFYSENGEFLYKIFT